ncbi:MAG: hypothetical protein ACKN81_13555, partial [Pirellulaceae bacterium]
MSIIQPTGTSTTRVPLEPQEVGGMLERLDSQGQVTERLVLSLGDWQVIPDEQGKLRVMEAMHVTPRPPLFRLRVWRSRIGVAWESRSLSSLPDDTRKVERLEGAATEKLIDCETDLQSGGERFRLIPSQQTIQTGWTPLASHDSL